MRDTLNLLQPSDFPPIRRGTLETLQANITLLCNQACLHCHTNSNPYRKERMGRQLVELVAEVVEKLRISRLDITGGAPEMHPDFRWLVQAATRAGARVMDRCNLSILEQPGYEDLAEFLARQEVEIIASLPCYSRDNVDRQRGKGIFDASIRALKKLNALGYGRPDNALTLHLVYNPQGATLPPDQKLLEAQYKNELLERFGIVFNQLFNLSNMPIKRFGSALVSRGQFGGYMELLKQAHQDGNLEKVMCRNLVSVDWQGYLFDCDFNQMLALNMAGRRSARLRLRDLLTEDITHAPIRVRDHCYGCTAGQGSSCGGALR